MSRHGRDRLSRKPLGVNAEEMARVRLLFAADCTGRDVCRAADALQLPLAWDDAVGVRYALVELLNNAVRASQDCNTPAPARLAIWREGERLCFEVSDAAGGFDVDLLPYDFNGPDEKIDIESDDFDSYREANDSKRFGLGVLLARRAVDGFRLAFVDAEGNEVPWKDDGSVYGSVITFSRRVEKVAAVPDAEGREHRRCPRLPAYAKASAGRRLAYVRDLSEGGARISMVGSACPGTGDRLRLKCVLPSEDDIDISVQCEVVWSGRIGPYSEAGVRFLALEETARCLQGALQALEAHYGGDGLPATVVAEVMNGEQSGRQ